jgi:hypothetical protein
MRESKIADFACQVLGDEHVACSKISMLQNHQSAYSNKVRISKEKERRKKGMKKKQALP